jgi:hypothetical protein
MKEEDFKFYLPIDIVKGEKEEDDWRIEGVASTPDEDLQGETVDQSGLDISMLKAGRGLFNWDHQKGPEFLLGQIEDADFVNDNGKKALKVKGYLFKHQDKSKALYNVLKSLKKANGPRVHMSIEGKVVQRDFVNNKAIKKARIDKVALTMDPVNPYTYAELVKSLNNPEQVQESTKPTEDAVLISKSDLETLLEFAQKALSAGSGYASAPSSRTGGSAMCKESMDGSAKVVTHGKKKKKPNKDMLKSIMKSLRDAHPSEDPLKLAEWMLEIFIDKFDDEKGE